VLVKHKLEVLELVKHKREVLELAKHKRVLVSRLTKLVELKVKIVTAVIIEEDNIKQLVVVVEL